MEANSKKSRSDQHNDDSSSSSSSKLSRNITCCIITPYVSRSSFNTPHTNVIQLYTNNRSPPNKLILDSRTTAHLIANKELILGYYKDFEQYQTGSGELLLSYDKGIIQILLDNSNLTLLNVYYASDLRCNLISTILLGKKGIEIFL